MSFLLLLVVPSSAAQIVNYSVSVFTGYAGTNYATSGLSVGQSLVHSTSTGVGGYVVTIPANVQSGYLIVAGYVPIFLSSVSGSGWVNAANPNHEVPNYVLQSNPQLASLGTNQGATDVGSPFSGVVYIPAHTNTLYLIVYGTGRAEKRGARSLSGAFINFVPESAGSDYSSILQQILSQLQGLKAEASSILDQITSTPEENQAAQAIVDQIEQTMEEIEELNRQIEDNTNRPEPDDLLPSAPSELLPPSDGAAVVGYELVTSMLSSPFMLSFLLMVFTLAFIRYVLFGKHDS